MDSPTPPELERRLRRSDYLALLLLCTLLYGFSLIHPRLMNAHEAVHCLNVREMLDSGQWLIATYGGRPWLERPPVPHWLTAVGVMTFGDACPERAYRIGSILVATLAVLVLAWAVAGCLGRQLGLLSGAVLATMREYAAYAVAPEADIFLASAVTIAGSFLMRTLFDPVARETRTSFFGTRSWSTVGFFAMIGAMNSMKGPLFGLFFTLLPLGAFWLWDRSWTRIKPLFWFWGWLLTVVIGGAWPLYAYLHHPDIIDLWAVDYGVRWKTGYIGEPWWYYLGHQPWNMFPWTIPAVVGFLVTARSAWRASPLLRFVWCWAIVPIAFFSLFKGKHHHYMLNCLAPMAVLGAVGVRWIWEWLQAHAKPALGMAIVVGCVGLPGAAACYILRTKIPGPDWAWIVWAAGCLTIVVGTWWAMTRPNWRTAIVACVAIIVVVHSAVFELRTTFADDYRDDLNLLAKAPSLVPEGHQLYVLGEFDPLNASWHLLYLNGKARLLHNESFVCDSRIATPDVYVICRGRDLFRLIPYGELQVVKESRRTRGDKSGTDHYALYRVVLRSDLERVPAESVRITPNQATGREIGPFLGPAPFYATVKPTY